MNHWIQKQLRQFEWAVPVQAVSFCTVDVIHQQYHLFFRQFFERRFAFGKNIADILMILFAASFLPECVGITVVDRGSWESVFSCFQILAGSKLTSAIGQDDLKGFAKKDGAQFLFEPVKDAEDFFLGL